MMWILLISLSLSGSLHEIAGYPSKDACETAWQMIDTDWKGSGRPQGYVCLPDPRKEPK